MAVGYAALKNLISERKCIPEEMLMSQKDRFGAMLVGAGFKSLCSSVLFNLLIRLPEIVGSIEYS